MDEATALREIQGYAAAGRIAYSRHADARMQERGVSRHDCRRALATATRAASQANETWRVTGGRDVDGDDLTVVVAIEGGVLVVTVY